MYRLMLFRHNSVFLFSIANALTIGLFLVVFGASSDLRADGSTRNDLKGALIEMGYNEVNVDGCQVVFSRLVQPTEKNNGYYKYTRVISLNSLKYNPAADIQYSSGSRAFYQLNISVREGYLDERFRIFEFKKWAEKEYPSSEWPYAHPEDHDDNTLALEYAFRSRFADLSQLNMWVSFSELGHSTKFPPSFQLTYPSRALLLRFHDALVLYASQTECLDSAE